jgi:tetratricopeptide (TPR) repeat protein
MTGGNDAGQDQDDEEQPFSFGSCYHGDLDFSANLGYIITMFGFLKRIVYSAVRSVTRGRPEPGASPDGIVEEKWEADFTVRGPKENSGPSSRRIHRRLRFDVKSENSHDAWLERRSLGLGLKKTNCIAWVDAPEYRYRDQVIETRLRLDGGGGYAAAGIMFRIIDGGTYYSALISNKGYFRLDAVRNGMPFPLVGWTETPEEGAGEAAAPEVPEPSVSAAPGNDAGAAQRRDMTIIAYGAHLVLLVDGRWAAAVNDASISSGALGFALASYEAASPGAGPVPGAGKGGNVYAARAFLDCLSVETRVAEVEAAWNRWNEDAVIPARSHFRLAETFAAMAAPAPALAQIRKAWEARARSGEGPERGGAGPAGEGAKGPDGDADRPAGPAGAAARRQDAPDLQRELLLAGRMAFQLERYGEAERYIDACLEADRESGEGREAAVEKAKLLYAAGRFAGLRDYLDGIPGGAPALREDPVLHTLLGHALWNLQEYERAAEAYDRAFELDGENGIPAKNAANVYEFMGKKAEALDRLLKSGAAFLGTGSYGDLGALAPKLLLLGRDDWRAHALAGKWAYGIEDWSMAEAEFSRAEELRRAMKPRPPLDPAVSYLRGLLFVQKGRRRDALPLLEEAARFAPDYGLFQFRLAENRFLLSGDAKDPRLSIDLGAALALMDGDGWVHNFAAQVYLARGDLDGAAEHLERAAALLGNLPAVRVNRGVYHYLRGSLEEALKILEAEQADDPEGTMANCAGNLLVRGGRYEEAEEYYRRALSIAPDNGEFLSNRASCLIETGRYGEADDVLARAYRTAPSPEILDLISYVAAKKGEFARAETASLAALEMNDAHSPSLFSLGWLFCSQGRWEEAGKILSRLDRLAAGGKEAERREELRRRIEDGTTRPVQCASCGRSWRVMRDIPPGPPLRLYAMPPDDLPAGSCPECGAAWCIGCAKKKLDENGRFVCPSCGRTLKLIDEGLKKIVGDWAAAAIPPAHTGQ